MIYEKKLKDHKITIIQQKLTFSDDQQFLNNIAWASKIIREKFCNKNGNLKVFWKLEVLQSLNQQLQDFQENANHRKNPPKKKLKYWAT